MKKLRIILLLLLTISAAKAQDYKRELSALNNYLRTFDNGFFGYLEVKDGYIYTRFKTGGFNKFKMEDMQDAVVENNKVFFKCKNDAYCQTTDWKVNSNNYSHFYGDNATSAQLLELKNLLNNFKRAYLNESNTSNTDENIDALSKTTSINTTSSSNSNTSKVNGNYQIELNKLNDYLKTFDDGYYGYLEIKDGILYDRFKSGKYTKTAMNQLATAKVETEKRKIIIPCKNGESCVFSTYTDSYHNQLSFSQSTDFNTAQLVTLFNNFISAYNGGITTPTKEIKYTESSEFLDGTNNNASDKLNTNKPNVDIVNNSPINTTKSESNNYTSALAALNAYLTQFDDTRYKGIEIKDGVIYSNYANGNYSKANMSDIDKAYLNAEYKYVKLACKSGKECVYSSITKSYHEYFNFQTSTGKDLNKMLMLLNNFIDAYLNSLNQNSSSKQKEINHDELKSDIKIDDIFENAQTKNTTSSNNSNSIQKALDEVNAYMITLDNGRYKGFKVEGDYLVNYYENNQYSKAKISDLGYASFNNEYNYAKLDCKESKNCIYSTFTYSYHDYFNFNITEGKSGDKMVQLLNNLLDAFNNKNSSTSTSTTSANRTDRNTEAKQRQESQSKEKVSDEEFWEDFAFFLGEEDSQEDSSHTSTTKSTTNSNQNYQEALKKLNDYLPTFNKETYRTIEVKNGYVFFAFNLYNTTYTSKISINSLKQNTMLVNASYNTVKIQCKGESDCFYSTYSNGNVNHFQFFTYSVKELETIKKLLQDFIQAL
jgi:hypothetical protein